jgi:hypothetical protein
VRDSHSAARGPQPCDVIMDEDPESPLPHRRVALQALAAVMPVESRQTRLLPLAFAALCLPLSWLLVPDDAPVLRIGLAAAMLAFAASGAWMLRRRSSQRLPTRSASKPQPALLVLPRDFERFIGDGIVASRRRGRSVALLRFGFVLPEPLCRDQRQVVETIGETMRDVTRAYDFVHLAGDGTIVVFIAHLPGDMPADSLARRILDDLQVIGSPSGAATCIEMKMVTLAEDEPLRTFINRLVEVPTVFLRQ